MPKVMLSEQQARVAYALGNMINVLSAGDPDIGAAYMKAIGDDWWAHCLMQCPGKDAGWTDEDWPDDVAS